VQERFIKLIKKKENVMLNHFLEDLTASALDRASRGSQGKSFAQGESPEDKLSGLHLAQLQDLKLISDALAHFSTALTQKLQRVEAIADYGEQHEEKYCRLFGSANDTTDFASVTS
jgi:hypothetical protein